MRKAHITLETHALDFWLARGAIVLIAGLQLLFINNNLPFGPKWLAPAVEMAMLLPLSVATTWTQGRFRNATADHHWQEVFRYRKMIRGMALLLTVTVMLRHLPQRGSRRPPGRRHPARTERRMGRATLSLHASGNHGLSTGVQV